MYRLWVGVSVLVWVGCRSGGGVEALSAGPMPRPESKDPCKVLREALPPLVPPFQVPTGQSLPEPFPIEGQNWLKKRFSEVGVYTPVGRWRGPAPLELWLIERLTGEGTFYYAVLVDSLCEVQDTALWAYQWVQPDRLEQGRAEVDRTGTCTITIEKHIATFAGEQPQTTTTTERRAYAVDWAGRKLRPL